MINENELKKGDIIINEWAGARNPIKKLLFIRKSSIKQGRYTQKTLECFDYRGRKVHLMRDYDHITKVGHMSEFDAFISALKQLKDNIYDE